MAPRQPQPAKTPVEQGNENEPKGPICLNCKKVVNYPDFECSAVPGKHRLAPKTYYHEGARHLHPVETRRAFSPTLVLRPAVENFDSRNERVVEKSGLSVTFAHGKYTTSRADEQYYLDRHNECQSGDEGLAMWRSVYLTTAQNLDLGKQQLEEVNRQLREQSSLLEQQKAAAGVSA